jgi:16S rRNA C1402 N4-methylase RsmH
MIEENQYHTTVLLRESVEALHPKVGGVYVDATFGGGGHTKLLLQQLDATAQVFAFDQDQDAAENLPKNECCAMKACEKWTESLPIWACRVINSTKQNAVFRTDLKPHSTCE